MKKYTCLIVFLLIATAKVSSQGRSRYAADVETIKQYDKIYPPPKDPVLFVGSSSFRLWSGLERTFSDYSVLNRGIGGAVIDEISYHVNDLIFAYNPKQIVIYVGENDIVDTNSTAENILQRTKLLLTQIRQRLPVVPIVYISMKPSPSRQQFFSKAIESNKLIRNYITTQANMQFVDIYNLMLTADGKPRPELFISDQLHMNNDGYAIWANAVRPYLLKK